MQDGLTGLYKGAMAAGAGTITQRAFVTSAFELCYTKWSQENLDQANSLIMWQTVVAGFAAGSLRSLIECPFEYFKVRRMCGKSAHMSESFSGFRTLFLRSTILLTTYFTYVDAMRRGTTLMEHPLG